MVSGKSVDLGNVTEPHVPTLAPLCPAGIATRTEKTISPQSKIRRTSTQDHTYTHHHNNGQKTPGLIDSFSLNFLRHLPAYLLSSKIEKHQQTLFLKNVPYSQD
jgi:hypothetical protein